MIDPSNCSRAEAAWRRNDGVSGGKTCEAGLEVVRLGLSYLISLVCHKLRGMLQRCSTCDQLKDIQEGQALHLPPHYLPIKHPSQGPTAALATHDCFRDPRLLSRPTTAFETHNRGSMYLNISSRQDRIRTLQLRSRNPSPPEQPSKVLQIGRAHV